jgi:DNA topoisomerase 2-associated protein PAT1
MTQHDKDLVQRIQLTQLASGDPYADDFYYQVYSSLRMRGAVGGNKPTASITNESRGGRSGRREDSMVQRMQQQVQRIVNDAKRRPKQTQGKYPLCMTTPPLIHPLFFL